MSTDEEFFKIIQRNGYAENGMLNDLHMSRFMNMVPSFNMQCTLFVHTLQFINQNIENNEFIQILFHGPNNDAGHWICIWYDTAVIRVYDNLNGELHNDHKKYINRFVTSTENNIYICLYFCFILSFKLIVRMTPPNFVWNSSYSMFTLFILNA